MGSFGASGFAKHSPDPLGRDPLRVGNRVLLDALQHRARCVRQAHALSDEGISQGVVVGEFVVGVDGVRESHPPAVVRGGVKNL